MANTLNVNALPDYVEVHKDELLVKSALGAKTLDYIEIMPNVKYKDALEYLDSEVVLADGSECGWNPQGGDTFTERYIEVAPVAVQKEFCWKEMRKKYLNHQLMFEAGRETLPYEEKIAEANVNAITEAVETGIWQGIDGIDTGLLAKLATDADYNATFTEGDDIVTKVNAMVAAAAPIFTHKKNANLFMSVSDYIAYATAINGSCLSNGHSPIFDSNADKVAYPGNSALTIVPVSGLEGTGKMVIATADALVYGTDVEGSESTYRMIYDSKEQKFLFDVLFNFGTAVKKPWEAVLGA